MHLASRQPPQCARAPRALHERTHLPTGIGVRLVFQQELEEIIMQVMLILILQRREIDLQPKLTSTPLKTETSQMVLLVSSQSCRWLIHGRDLHMYIRSVQVVQFPSLLGVVLVH